MTNESGEDHLPDGGRLRHTDRDMTFDVLYFDGIGLPKIMGLLSEGTQTRLQAIRDMETRDNDILLVNYPKTGTHWVWEITNMLVKGKAEYHKYSKVSLMLEATPDLKLIDAEGSPRVINTHLPYRWLPKKHVEHGGKIIHVSRNPKDTYVSLYHHFVSSDGGGGYGSKDMTWNTFFENVVMGKVPVYEGWLKFEKEMQIAKRGEYGRSIHSLQYEQLKQNPMVEIKKIANFLEISCSGDLLVDIEDKCSFEKLKSVPKAVPEEFRRKVMAIAEKTKQEQIKRPFIYRKGVVGDWKNYFTVKQNERFDELFEKEIKTVDMTLDYTSQ